MEMAEEDKKVPTPEELQRGLQEMLGRMGAVSFTAPGVSEEGAVQAAGRREQVFEFGYKPRDIKAHLDRFVIRQDEAKKALAIAVCDHYNHAKYMCGLADERGRLPEGVELQKQNVIVVQKLFMQRVNFKHLKNWLMQQRSSKPIPWRYNFAIYKHWRKLQQKTIQRRSFRFRLISLKHLWRNKKIHNIV